MTTDSDSQQPPGEPEAKRGHSCFGYALITFVVLFILAALLLPALQPASSGGGSPCKTHLRIIGIALQTYHDAHHCFPPAYIADEQGTPMHSWRILLLPYFEEEELKRLYQQYRFDEPWNGPNNSKLLAKAPYMYRCPHDVSDESNSSYLAVVGPETMWRGIQPMNIREITDGTSKTIAILECSDSGVNWLEPRDALFEDAASGINVHSTRPAFRSNHTGGAFALFADASAHFLTDSINRDTLRGLLTPASGETVEIPE